MKIIHAPDDKKAEYKQAETMIGVLNATTSSRHSLKIRDPLTINALISMYYIYLQIRELEGIKKSFKNIIPARTTRLAMSRANLRALDGDSRPFF